MILKGSQRGGGQNLAAHLMRTDDNEHVLVHELRGFASDTIKGAFKEAEAISRGTKCEQYLFSLSLSPPENACIPAEAFDAAIDRVETRLGLEGQPRAVVFHEKEGRRHAHCVWSRIDADTMTARQLSFFKTKLMAVSRDLYLDHGWTMPKGMAPADGTVSAAVPRERSGSAGDAKTSGTGVSETHREAARSARRASGAVPRVAPATGGAVARSAAGCRPISKVLRASATQ